MQVSTVWLAGCAGHRWRAPGRWCGRQSNGTEGRVSPPAPPPRSGERGRQAQPRRRPRSRRRGVPSARRRARTSRSPSARRRVLGPPGPGAAVPPTAGRHGLAAASGSPTSARACVTDASDAPVAARTSSLTEAATGVRRCPIVVTTSAQAAGSTSCTSTPPTVIDPDRSSTRFRHASMSVDFPTPLGPYTAVIVPGSTSRSRPSTITRPPRRSSTLRMTMDPSVGTGASPTGSVGRASSSWRSSDASSPDWAAWKLAPTRRSGR